MNYANLNIFSYFYCQFINFNFRNFIGHFQFCSNVNFSAAQWRTSTKTSDKNNQNKSAQKKFLFVSFHFFTPERNLILIAQRQIKPNSTNIVRLYSESQWWKIEILTSVVKGLKILSENSSVAGQPWPKDKRWIFCALWRQPGWRNLFKVLVSSKFL